MQVDLPVEKCPRCSRLSLGRVAGFWCWPLVSALLDRIMDQAGNLSLPAFGCQFGFFLPWEWLELESLAESVCRRHFPLGSSTQSVPTGSGTHGARSLESIYRARWLACQHACFLGLSCSPRQTCRQWCRVRGREGMSRKRIRMLLIGISMYPLTFWPGMSFTSFRFLSISQMISRDRGIT